MDSDGPLRPAGHENIKVIQMWTCSLACVCDKSLNMNLVTSRKWEIGDSSTWWPNGWTPQKCFEHPPGDQRFNCLFTPAIGELFKSILTRLSYKNEVCIDDDPGQAGFKRNSRTIDNIFILQSLLVSQKAHINLYMRAILTLRKHSIT